MITKLRSPQRSIEGVGRTIIIMMMIMSMLIQYSSDIIQYIHRSSYDVYVHFDDDMDG